MFNNVHKYVISTNCNYVHTHVCIITFVYMYTYLNNEQIMMLTS